jgi:desulfoferrodoxin (superoxide reductase-like protein)
MSQVFFCITKVGDAIPHRMSKIHYGWIDLREDAQRALSVAIRAAPKP